MADAPTEPTKAITKLLDRHSRLREAHGEAYAAVETSDDALDSVRGKRLVTRRDTAWARLVPVAAKLRAAGYTLAHDDSAPVLGEPKAD